MGAQTEAIRASGADVAAIAVSTIFSQQEFARQLAIDVPLLSDWNREVSAAYGVLYDTWKGHDGVAKRAIFVMDATGVVRYAWHTDEAELLPELDPVLEAVGAL